MSRTSRIPHPPGSRFVSLYHWAVRRFGIGGAAVLGLLDFLDRAHDEAGTPLASRARIVAELEGIVGKHVVDRALKNLVVAGAVRQHKETTMGDKNWETRVDYSLDILGLRELLAPPEDDNSGNSRNRESREFPIPDPEPGVPTNKDLEVYAVAAPRAHARGPADAAATKAQVGKRRRKRESGIVTWDAADIADAEKIERTHPANLIQAAVAALLAVSKQPVPGLVAWEIERQQRLRAAKERGAAAEAKLQMRLQADPSKSDLAAVERGCNLLAENFRALVKRSQESKNGQA